MSDWGSAIWFVGLGVGIVILGLAVAYASTRRRQRSVAHPNAAWQQAADEAGDETIAKAPPPT